MTNDDVLNDIKKKSFKCLVKVTIFFSLCSQYLEPMTKRVKWHNDLQKYTLPFEHVVEHTT